MDIKTAIDILEGYKQTVTDPVVLEAIETVLTARHTDENDNIFYVCDRKQCEKCSYPQCRHTSDISHAASFVKDGLGTYSELDPLLTKRLKKQKKK